jgi:tyrosyl-tRNA synthetase
LLALARFQRFGHHPIAVAGGATGSIGDPSGKSAERSLLTKEQIAANVAAVRPQLERFLDFKAATNPARLVDNADWTAGVSYLDFLRGVGKHFTVNVMVAKESVRARMEDREVGISYTEFSYMLLQAFDFSELNRTYDCQLQIGGSDQWGNITLGIDLVRKKGGGHAFGLTLPLITKADGTKFGKTENGNLWLDAKRTSPYEFFQFWLNASDDDVKNYLRIFTLLDRTTIEGLEHEHDAAPHLRVLQKTLAKDITARVHGAQHVDTALAASELLFGKGSVEQLRALSDAQFLEVVVGAGVPVAEVARDTLAAGINLVDLFTEHSGLVASKGEARKLAQANALSVNKEKLADPKAMVGTQSLLSGRYLLLQKGKKDYCVVKAV